MATRKTTSKEKNTTQPKTTRKSKPATRKTESSSRGGRKTQIIYAQASPLSKGGVSMFDAGNQINAETCANFISQDSIIEQSIARLENAGFKVLQTTRFTINFSGTRKQFFLPNYY